MSGRTNSADRVPLVVDPDFFVQVFKTSQLPDPVFHEPTQVERHPIKLGVHYQFQKGIDVPPLLLPTFVPGPTPQFTEISSISQNAVMLFANASTPLFWGRGVGNFRLRNLLIQDSLGFQSEVFDLTGVPRDVDPSGTANALFLVDVGILAFESLGRIVDMGANIERSGWIARRGLVVRAVDQNALGEVKINFTHIGAPFFPPMETPMITYQGPQNRALITAGTLALQPGAASFGIDSGDDSTGDYVFAISPGAETPTSGNFFRADVSKAMSKFEEVDKDFLSVSDSSVAPGVHTTITFSTTQEFVHGDVVLVKGDSVSTYDGLHPVVRVSEDQKSIDINVAIGSDTAGKIKITRVTAVGHGLVGYETHTRSGTTSYNGTDKILFRVDDDRFDISVAFNGDDATGTVTSVSKNEKSVGIVVSNCGHQQPSRSVGAFHVDGNTNETVVGVGNQDVYGTFGLDPLTVTGSTAIERFVFTDDVSGVVQFIDDHDDVFAVNIDMSVSNGNPPRVFEFSVFVDSGAGFVENTHGLLRRTTLRQGDTQVVAIAGILPLKPNDKVMVKGRNKDSETNYLVEQMSFSLIAIR